MSVKFLKVKVKSLAAEARIIRLEEKRAGKNNVVREHLHRHRTRDVRMEQRASLLAYAFLRGRPLAAVEPKRGAEREWQAAARWKRVAEIVKKFGPGLPTLTDQESALKAWLAAEPAKV